MNNSKDQLGQSGIGKIKRNVDSREADLLDYSIELDNFKRIFDNVKNSFVISLEAPWGTGKSTFLDILAKEMNHKTVIKINAWEEDYKDDPVTTIVFDLSKKLGKLQGEAISNKLKKIGLQLSKDIVPTISSVLISMLPIPILGKLLKSAVESLIDQLEKKDKALEDLRDTIAEAINEIEHNQIIIFVDELDRCKPSYAVKFLETIKHFFDVDGLIFLLAIEDKVLQESFKQVYGRNFQSQNYLKRFVDLRLKLQPRITLKIIENSFQAYNLGSIISEHDEDEISIEVYLDLVFLLSKLTDSNARNINQISTNFALSLLISDLKNKNLLLTLFLIVLKQNDRNLYEKYLSKEVTVKKFYEDIKSIFLIELPSDIQYKRKETSLIRIYEIIFSAKLIWNGDKYDDIHDWFKSLENQTNLPDNQRLLKISLDNILNRSQIYGNNELMDSLSMITATNRIKEDE